MCYQFYERVMTRMKLSKLVKIREQKKLLRKSCTDYVYRLNIYKPFFSRAILSFGVLSRVIRRKRAVKCRRWRGQRRQLNEAKTVVGLSKHIFSINKYKEGKTIYYSSSFKNQWAPTVRQTPSSQLLLQMFCVHALSVTYFEHIVYGQTR